MEYWKECIEEAIEASGVEATNAQIEEITSWVESAHENYSLATGQEFIPNPLQTEIDAIKREAAKKEREHHRQLRGVCVGVASRRGIRADSVSIDGDGRVTFDCD